MSSKMDLKPIFERINFAERYRNICDIHEDFNNRMRGTNKSLYETTLRKFSYSYKYYSDEKFYKIEQEVNQYVITFNLVLKDGIVEPIIYIKKEGKLCSPDGRFDFLPEDMNIPFERKRYNLPNYTSVEELESILKEIFSIYEDIKVELSHQS